jgi:hypothetical protein
MAVLMEEGDALAKVVQGVMVAAGRFVALSHSA